MKKIRIPQRVEVLLRDIGRIAAARGHRAYAVGGCVRDWLLGKPTTDLDVTVEGDAIGVARAVSRALSGSLEVHQQFGTATVTIRRPACRIDFATCRTEQYAKPAAYPKVAPGTLEDDLFRRDFTMNAMAVGIAPGMVGGLIDPFGGRMDLARKSLRVLHERSFLDDPSRMLRGIRFAQRFSLRWEPQTKRLRDEAVAAGALGWLNAGRLRKELERMTEEPDPGRCLREFAALLDNRSIQHPTSNI